MGSQRLMEYRFLGQTGLKVSVLSFGCGAVGGLMVKGAASDQERAVARAMEFGINYFDTAPMYGNGESERNLGRVLKNLKRPKVYVGTKVWLDGSGDIARSVSDSMEASLRRLGQDSVDLYQLHNLISDAKRDVTLDPATVREQVLPAFERLREQGKARFFGFTALGETPAIHSVVEAFDSAQVSYNLLNPSAGAKVPSGYPAQDYGNLLARAHASGVGTIGIRALAGGALSGVETRHPLGMPSVDPIGSASTYAGDVARAVRFGEVIKQGFSQSLIEASLRFVLSNPNLSTTLVGLSTLEQLERAGHSAEKGSLPAEALKLISTIQKGFVGETR
jgi:L-galactose dehydrogenase/L-glyceraldehyde 3-phosphate reductase